MKIETLNPEAVQSKAMAPELQAFVETPRRGVSTVPDIKSGDTLTLSISTPVSGEKLSSLLSDLIKAMKTPAALTPFVGAGLAPAQDGQPHGLPLLGNQFYKGEEPLSFLKKFIENSGLLYEAKIAKGDIKGLEGDLKGVLLKLIEKQGEKSEAGKTANTLVSDIEAKQLLNVKSNEEGGLQLQIPVLFPEGASAADIHVSRDGKGKGEYVGDSHRIGFSIELRNAGLVSIDALVQRNNVSIRLQAEKADFLEFMKTQIPELTERLSGYGMKCL